MGHTKDSRPGRRFRLGSSHHRQPRRDSRLLHGHDSEGGNHAQIWQPVMTLDDTEFEHLDRDRNGELDRAEGTKYLNHYVRGYRQMDDPSRRSILDTFMLDL